MNFEQTLNDTIAKQRASSAMESSNRWHRFKAGQTGSVKDNGKNKPDVVIGGMYMFHYDPKTKDNLPYYDTFPVIFPIEPAEGGFFGLNMHYLHPKLRARLFDQLVHYTNNDKMDKTTKLKVSYQLLKGASTNKLFVPCLKRYLRSHVKSSFLYIDPDDWFQALMLPLQDFKKATAKQVWKASAAKLRKD